MVDTGVVVVVVFVMHPGGITSPHAGDTGWHIG